MPNTPRISLIVPCHNYGRFLAECLDSVRAQDTSDWECLIVDNASTDDTRAVALPYTQADPRFRYFFLAQKGVSFARNFGIAQSSGQYLLPLDADDRIAITYLRQAAAILDAAPHIQVVYSDARHFGALNTRWTLPEYSLKELLIENLIFCSAMYRREDYDRTNGYNENMREGFEDWDFWISLLKDGGQVHKIPEELFYYRIRAESRNNTLDPAKQIALRRRLYENHRETYDRFFDLPSLLYEYYGAKCRSANLQRSRDYRWGRAALSPVRFVLRLLRSILPGVSSSR